MYLLRKAKVKAHPRRTKDGGVTQVREHEDKRIDHAAYQKKVRKLSDESLRYIIKDAREAIEAMPDGRKAGYYADEINYCAQELHRRQKAAGKRAAA